MGATRAAFLRAQSEAVLMGCTVSSAAQEKLEPPAGSALTLGWLQPPLCATRCRGRSKETVRPKAGACSLMEGLSWSWGGRSSVSVPTSLAASPSVQAKPNQICPF